MTMGYEDRDRRREDERRWAAKATEVANRIRAIDLRLDDLERQTARSVSRGMRLGGWAGALKPGQEAADAEHARLLADRASLVVELKALVAERPEP